MSAVTTPTESNSRLPLSAVDRTRAPDLSASRQVVAGGGGQSNRLRWQNLLVCAALLLLGLAAGYWFGRPALPDLKAKEELASEQQPTAVFGLGKLLPLGDLLVIAPPFGASDARVASLAVVEGQQVQAGQLLATLDNGSQLVASLDSATATVQAREAVLAQTRAATIASMAEASAAVSKAQAIARSAQSDFDRSESLFNRQFQSASALDKSRSVRDESRQEVLRTEAILSRYIVQGSRAQPDIVVAQRNVVVARKELERAVQELETSAVKAPRDGTVITIDTRPGEKPTTNGILSMGNIEVMTVEFEVYQAQMGKVAVGDSIRATSEALLAPLIGQVTKIGYEVGRQTAVDVNPAANTDARVVKVTATLDTASSKLSRRYTNLQVMVRLESAVPP